MAAIVVAQLPFVKNIFSMVTVPMVTFFVVGLLCIFNNALMKTKIGQQFRAVGQNRTVANASGINVDRVRVIAIVISTVLAGWGQLIFVQNMGSFQTYGAHEQVGLYAGAAILVGGASIKKATNGQALLGCILFHLLFIVAPSAGRTCLVTLRSVSTSVYSFPTELSLWHWLCMHGETIRRKRINRL